MGLMNLSHQFDWEKGEQVEMEKRKSRRFLAQDMAFAVFRPYFTKLGKVRDISKSGMAFEYVTFEGAKEDSGEVDLFVSGTRFHLSRIPAQTVYDSGVANDHYSFSPLVERRRCGVKFGELTEGQAKQLRHFIETHTTGLAP